MFIPYQTTPNPDALKFLPPTRLGQGQPQVFEVGTQTSHPLARALLAVEGVTRVLIADTFVSVSRRPRGPGWPELKPAVMMILAQYCQGVPETFGDAAAEPAAPTPISDLDAEIRQVVQQYVRPGALADGGDIIIERFDEDRGVLVIRMEGACNGCPSSQMTLKAGVEQIVRRFVPEVRAVELAALPRGAPREGLWRRLLKTSPDGASNARRPVFSHNGQPLPGDR